MVILIYKLDDMINEVLNKERFYSKTNRAAERIISDSLIGILYGLNNPEIKNIIHDRKMEMNNETYKKLLNSDYYFTIKDLLLIYGTAVVSNELDEGNTEAKGHPASHIFPILLIYGDKENYTSREVIHSFIKAYEISGRIAKAFKMKDDVHPHGTWGIVGTAVAKAILLGYRNEEVISIVKLGLSLPISTSWYAAEDGENVRNLYTGIGSLIGDEIVSLSSYGFKSNDKIYGHIWQNFIGNNIEIGDLTVDLLQPPLVEKNYFKKYPTCRFTHASIDATLNIVNNHAISQDEINNINVETYDLASRCDVQYPVTSLQSKFSIPYALSCIVLNLNLFDEFEKNIEKMRGLPSKIDVRESHELTSLLPDKRAARVSITLKDGARYSEECLTAKGEYTNPLSELDFQGKYREMLVNDYPEFTNDEWLDKVKSLSKYDYFNDWLNELFK